MRNLVKFSYQMLKYVLFICLIPVAVLAQDVEVKNSAHYVNSGRYNWTVCLKASDSVLSSINSVEYTLHPTFTNPIRKGTGRNFAISESGSSEFRILVKIEYKNKNTAKLVYKLNLSEESTACSIPKASSKARKRPVNK